MKKIIIIGGVAAGMTAASNLARKGKNKIKFVVYEKRNYASFGACGIPFYIGGHAKDKSMLVSPSVQKHLDNGINLKVNHEIIKVDFDNKKVLVKNLTNNKTFTDHYDELLITTGANPIIPKWYKSYNGKMTFATTLEEAVYIKKQLKNQDIKDVVIVGGGFIGVEIAENILQKHVTLIEGSNKIMGNLTDKDISNKLIDYMKKDINVYLDELIIKVEEKGKKLIVTTNHGKEFKTDLVIVAIGFKPNTDLFSDKIIKNDFGAILVNNKGQTSIKDVYAAGDCATIRFKTNNKDVYIPLATTSRKLGKIVAFNMMGQNSEFLGTLGSSGLKFKNIEFFSSGEVNNSNNLSVKINTTDTPNYAGNPQPLLLELFCNKNGVLVGARALGYDKGAAIRISCLATAIWNKMLVHELAQMDLFYTPPFTRATDIIHIAASSLEKLILKGS